MGMANLRKLWFPQAGQGSQSEEISFTKALIKGMNAHIVEREKQFAEWLKEDEEMTRQIEAKKAAKKKTTKKK